MKDFDFGYGLVFLDRALDMTCQVANLAILHHYDQWVITEETFFVAYDVRVIKILQYACLSHARILFVLSKAFESDFLRNVFDIFFSVEH